MPKQNIKIGEKIKRLRVNKEMSIAALSQKTGISEDVVAAIEKHEVSPQLGIIVCLAEVLRVSVGDLLGDSADSPFCIVRSDDRKAVSRFSSTVGQPGGYSYESLGHKKQNRKMEPFFVTLNPSEDRPVEPNQHVGEEILFVLSGQVEVTLAGHTDILKPGDSIYYDSSLPHVVSCHGAESATIFAVIYAKKDLLIL